jgi:Ca-activated chloride channel family protein
VQALRAIVDGIEAERALLPPGSDLRSAVQTAQRALESGTADTKVMLIVSDGEDRGAGVGEAVATAAKAGIRVYTAGAGTAEGTPVLDVDPATDVVTERVDASGTPVLTRLDAAALERIAGAGGGRYVALGSDGSPLTGLAVELKALTQTAFETKQSSVPIERFQIVAALALALLAGELAWPALRRPRAVLRSAARMWPLAGAGLLVGAICSATAASVNRHGNNDYASGDYDGAVSQYRTAEAMAPSQDELYHNAGNAFNRQGEYDKAIAETLRALPAQQALVSRLEYALGNHYVGSSELRDALEAYKRALLADPADNDSKHNLEVVTARLTPSPTARAQPTVEPNATIVPGATPGEGPQSGTPAATPGAGEGTGDEDLATSELERALSDALAGKDREFTEDEAIRVLELLDEANRRAVERLIGNVAAAAPPDY